MSEKSFHRSWTSQFGLYRYDDNYRRLRKECNTCFYGITGTVSIIIITIFIFVTNTDFDPPKRLIILSHENKSLHNQPSTASVVMQQIPTNYQIGSEMGVTTPLSFKMYHNQPTPHTEDSEPQPQKLELKSYLNMHNEAGAHYNHPNHRYVIRRQLEEFDQPRPFDFIVRGAPPAAFQHAHKNSTSFPQIPKEYVGTVNSIQDILKQVNGNNHEQSSGMQKIKIAGTYKQRKVDDIADIFESIPRKNRVQLIDQPLVQSHTVNANSVIRDPLYKYKPNPLSDVNLMAMNQFRFAPYNILSNRYVPTGSTHSHASLMDPSNLYHQIIMANKNRLKYLDENSKTENVQSKQKPFTLMLDVYPMPDDERISSTPTQPVQYQNHFNSNAMRYPGISPINNLRPFIYPSVNANRYPNLPHYNNPNYFRKFSTMSINSGLHSSSGSDKSGNSPSQITLHLNLFPKKKERSNNPNQNDETFNKNDKEDDVPELISDRLQDRMAKINQTDDQKVSNGTESTSVSNKVDMDVLQTTTISTVKQNVIMFDESSDGIDSSEDIFSKEFLQFQSTDSPIEFSSDSTTIESKSEDGFKLNLIPTILPIEPRGHNLHLDLDRKLNTLS